MEEKDNDLIERYYLDALSEAELAEFNRRLKEDEAFWEAANLHADALEAIRLDAIALLRKRLTIKGRELDAGEHKPGKRRLWRGAVLMAVLLGGWAVWRWMQPENRPAATPVIDRRDTPPPSAIDTIPASQPPQE